MLVPCCQPLPQRRTGGEAIPRNYSRPTQQSRRERCANSNTILIDGWPLWDYNRLVMNKENRTIKLRSYVTRPFYKAVRERAWQERLSMSALIQVWIRRGLDGPRVKEEER